MVVNQRGYMPNGQNVGGGAPFMQPQKPAGSGENLMTLLRRQIDQISSALPKFLSPDRLVRIIVTALRTTPKLAQCDPNSFLASVMLSAQLGLEVNTPMGQSYLIPYFDNKRNMMICNFQIGYRGVLELAYRSGEYQSLTAMAVYPEDKFEFAFGLEPVLKHIPANNRKADSEPSYYYAIYVLLRHLSAEKRRIQFFGLESCRCDESCAKVFEVIQRKDEVFCFFFVLGDSF